MKKIAFIALAAVAAFVSCQKEVSDSTASSYAAPRFFTASIAQNDTKAFLEVGATAAKIYWSDGDEITVTDKDSKSAIYKTGSFADPSTTATFTLKDGEDPLGEGPYTATFGTAPSKSVAQNGDAEAFPIYMTAEATVTDDLSFAAQCGVLKVNLKDASHSVKKIEVFDKGGDAGYTLTFTEAESIATAKDFLIALPAGEYTKIEIVDGNGLVATKAMAVEIQDNHVVPVKSEKLAFILKGVLPGVFSVSAEGKKVRFSRGNLWCDWTDFPDPPASWDLELNQYDVPPFEHGFDDNDYPIPSHAAFFTWTSFPLTDGVLDFGAPYCKEKGLPVGTWRVLTEDEWMYLLSGRGTRLDQVRYAITVCGLTNCVVIAPDGNETDIADSYSVEEWAVAEAAGFVCLAASGGSSDPKSSNIANIGVYGGYWSSTIRNEQTSYRVFFRATYLSPDSWEYHTIGNAVRLVTDVN